MTEKYFAKLPTNKIGNQIKGRVDKFYNFMYQSGIFRRQYRSMCHYYGISPASSAQTDMIRSGGKAGNLSMIKVNHFRNLAQHLTQLVVSQKPSPMPVATNSDAKSQKQVTLAKGILDYESRDKRIDRKFAEAAQLSVVGSESFIMSTWDDSASQGKSQGDVKIQVFPSCEVIRDPNKSNFQQLDWVVVREWSDRFILADKYAPVPESDDESQPIQLDEQQMKMLQIRNRILNQTTKNTYDRIRTPIINWMITPELFGNSDDIALYHFWHKKSASLPDGRYVVSLEDGTVIWDSDLPYKVIPVRRIKTADIFGTSFGYSPMFDLMVIQEVIDSLYSAVATNQMTFGVQLIMALKGSDLDYKQLARGLAFLEYSDPQAKPEPVNLTKTPAQIFAFIEQLQKIMETICGVNAVVRGDPPESLKSGSALALVQAQAIQFSSGLQASYASLVEDVYTDVLNIFSEFVDDARTITIVGKFNRSLLVSFKGQDLSEINRVVVQVASPLEQTVPGRMQIAQDLIQAQLLKSPEQYLNVIKTGNLDSLLQGDHAELILIKSENQNLADNKQVYALVTDDHSLHIREHRCVLATPEARQNPEMIQAVTNHIMEHVSMLGDPMLTGLLAAIGQNPIQPQVPMGAGPAADQMNQKQPGMPNMPKNPATGTPWNPKDGGMSQQPLDPGNPTGNAGGGGAV